MTTDESSASLFVIETALEGLGRIALEQSLLPGMAATAVRTSLGDVNLRAPAELVTLYGWRNGTSTTDVALDDIQMFPGFYMLSLEDAIANYRAFVNDSRWEPDWLPIFANGGGDFYLVDLAAPSGTAMRHFRIDETRHPIEFHSVTSFLKSLAEAFERGIFFVDSSGYLEMDDLVFAALAAEENPDVDWWQT
ncbi:SMI1/KNR4 family protein [Aeromicrobium panaciterrae]|uniref:SMI1/KNR4 family protein n=1 Tax=Aeromicrobium panaciterrae TaxID=363861 RepID=UPI0031D8A30C